MRVRDLLAALALAAGALLVPASRAAADDSDAHAERTFTVQFGGRDEALRDDCSRRLSAWWDEIVSPDGPAPAGWDEARFGPWSLVARTSGGGFVEERPGLVRVFVNVVADGLPSRRDTADAFCKALLGSLDARVQERAERLRSGTLEPAERAAAEAQTRCRLLRTDLSMIETAHGGPPDRRAAALADRLADDEKAASETRIERAVTAKKLEAARSAAERASDLEVLRRDADDLERRTNAEAAGSAGREALAARLAALRKRIDELTRTAPSLDTAREEVFRLEVDLVGLEARATVVAAEIEALRAESAKAQEDVRRYAPLARAYDVAQAGLDAAEARVREIHAQLDARGSVFEVIRAPGPPSRSQEGKR